MSKDKQIAEALGICWHSNWYEWMDCPRPHFGEWSLDFTTDAGKVQLLREIMKHKKGFEFLTTIGGYSIIPDRKRSKPTRLWILLDYLTGPDNCILRDKVWEFLCGGKEK